MYISNDSTYYSWRLIIKGLHENKGKTVSQCLKDRVDYAKNGEKTEKGEYVTAYECNPQIVDQEFYSDRSQYIRNHRVPTNDVIAYQIRQSFKPGEITPEEANAIGYELAKRFTKGDYAFIVAKEMNSLNKRKFEQLLPEIVKRLILASNSSVIEHRFPSGDDIWAPGYDGIANCERTRKEVQNIEELVKSKKKKYVRYAEGAELFSMGLHSFQSLAKDAGAIRKVKGCVLVNLEKVEEFVESFAEEDF